MTVVVGLVDGERIILGADSAVSAGCERFAPGSKIVRRGGLLFACAGPSRLVQLLGHVLDVPPDDGGDPYSYLVAKLAPAIREMIREHDGLHINNEHDGWEALIAYRGGLYSLCHDLSVTAYAEYASVGCGRSLALGSLHSTGALLGADMAYCTPPARVRLALEAAAAHDVHCSGPFRVEALESSGG